MSSPKTTMNPMLRVRRHPPKPADSKLLKAPVQYQSMKAKRALKIGR